MDECISVIIPVYNAQDTLAKCLDSFLNQTYTNIELILVDDGSTDQSAQILREYEKKDGRIRTLTQQNAGPSRARNRGMDVSRGEYLCFADSDDYVDEDYLEYLYKGLTEHDVNIATCGVRHEYEDGTEHGKQTSFPAHVAEAKEILTPYRDTYQGNIAAKLYRKSALMRPDGTMIHFQEDIRIGEDQLFWCEAILQNRRAWIDGEKKYHYIYHASSLYHARDYQRSWDDFVGRCRKEKLMSAIPELKKPAAIHTVDNAIYLLSFDRFDEKTKEMLAYIRKEKRWKTYFCSDRPRSRRVQALLIGIHPQLYLLVRKLRKKLKRA